jgi:hypothetical protein
MNLRTVRWMLVAYVLVDLLLGYAGFVPLTELAAAQFTTVTGTVTDPNGLPYAFGTIVPTLVTSASPTLNGFVYTPPTQPVGLDGTGSFTMQLADNTVLLPAATKWNFLVCSAIGTIQPAGGKGPVCFSLAAPITISGASQSITANISAVPPPALGFAGGGTPGAPSCSVQFNNGGAFAGDSNLCWDNTNKDLLIGSATTTGFGSNTFLELHSATQSNERLFTHSAGAGGFSAVQIMRSHGTQAAPTVISGAEALGELAFSGYDGSNYINVANIAAFSSQAFAVGTTPGSMQFTLILPPAVLTEVFRMGGGPSFNLNVSEIDTSVIAGKVLGFNSGGVGTAIDTAFSRDAAGAIDLGNGTAADKTGSLNLTTLTTLGEIHGYQAANSGIVRFGSDTTSFVGRLAASSLNYNAAAGGLHIFNSTLQLNAAAANLQFNSSKGQHIFTQAATSDLAGVLTCAASTASLTFATAYASTPTIVVSDETTTGGARVSAKSNTAFTITCTGATDVVAYHTIGNPN